MRFLLADRWHPGWLAAWFAVALVWLGDVLFGVLDPLEQAWSDQTQSAVAVRASSEIVLVAIDDASLAALGPWPWSREVHAQLIDRLSAAGVRQIVHTVPFVGAQAQPVLAQLQRIANAVQSDPQLADHGQLMGLVQQSQVLLDADGQLEQSVSQSHRTVLAVQDQAAAGLEWPLAGLVAAAVGVGQLRFEPDRDGVVRRHALQVFAGERSVPSLALWVAAGVQARPPAELQLRAAEREAFLGGLHWPTDRAGRVQPLWRPAAEPGGFARWSAAAVVAGAVPPGQLSNKTVLIGLTAPALVMPQRYGHAGTLAPLEALAQTSSALLSQQLVSRPRWAAAFEAALIAAMALYLVLWVPQLTQASAWALSALLAMVLLCASHLAMTQAWMELPVVVPLVALWCGHLALWVTRRRESLSMPVATSPAAPPPAGATVPLPLVARVLAQPAPAKTRPMPMAIALADLPPVAQPQAQPASAQPASAQPVSAPTVAAPTSTAPLPEQRARRLPRLGTFQLDHEIGRGAMGRVYLAHPIDGGAPVAVKTLALAREFGGFALREARTRFQREALAALRLRHPDIVQVIDAGEDQGYAWIAMELLNGHDLVRYTQAHNLLPVPEVLAVCARVAGALAHAHAQGVVHRDIKPANVMYDPSRGEVKVTDFGIARISDSSRTRTGVVLGSPSYMSPEHLGGGVVDGRSDLYSLGVLLFQLLTGALPAQGNTMADLMRAVAHTPAPDVRSLRPRLPEAVANIVTLALEKRAELRYPDAAAMEADLQAVRGLWGLAAATPVAHNSSHRTVQEVASVAAAQGRLAMVGGPLGHNLPG